MLKAVVTDLNTVDEADRKYYVQKDGKFFLNVTATDGFALEDVGGLKSALGAERNTVAQLREQLRPYEGIDAGTARNAIQSLAAFGEITPAAAKTALETAARLSEIDPAKEADRLANEKVTTQLNSHKAQWQLRETELTTQLNQSAESVKSLTGQLQGLMKGNQIKTELAKLNPLDDARDAIELLAGNFVRTSMKDGQVVVDVVDEAGNPRIKDVAGTPFTVADLLSELREKRPALFKAEEKRGMGLQPGGGGGGNSGTVNPWAKDTRNITQQMQLEISNPTLAASLKAAAGVKD